MKIINARLVLLLAILSFFASCTTLDEDIPTAIRTQERVSISPLDTQHDNHLGAPDLCRIVGKIRKIDEEDICNIIIEVDREHILVPVNSERFIEKIRLNEKIIFGYEELEEPAIECTLGRPVRITCFHYAGELVLEEPKQRETERKIRFKR